MMSGGIQQFVQNVLMWLTDLGYWGIMIGLMIEVIPSEIVLSYAGFLVSQGEIGFWGGVLFGTIGGVIAQIFVYWIGRYGGRPFLEKYGKYLLIRKKHIDVAEEWFNRYGTGVIFTARFIPVVRHAISVPAGIVKMPLYKFTLLTALAVIPWSVMFMYLGMTLGENWRQINQAAAPYVKPIMWTALALTVVYFFYQWAKRRRSGTLAHAGEAGERSTSHQLRFLGGDYQVFNGIRVRAGGRSQQFDHIVVGPNGVFHIDSKHWDGEIEFSQNGVQRGNGGYRGDPTNQMYRHEYILKELLRKNMTEAEVIGLICFTHPNCELIGKSPAFETMKLDRLLHFIKTYRTKKPLSAEKVKFIAKLIAENGNR